MYFIQVCNWFYQCMQVPVPIVIFNDQVALVTIFDVFMFLVYLGIFIVLMKFLITGSLDFRVYNEDFHYSTHSNFGRGKRESLLDKQYRENHRYTKVTRELKNNHVDNERYFFNTRRAIYNKKSIGRNVIFGKKKKG